MTKRLTWVDDTPEIAAKCQEHERKAAEERGITVEQFVKDHGHVLFDEVNQTFAVPVSREDAIASYADMLLSEGRAKTIEQAYTLAHAQVERITNTCPHCGKGGKDHKH